MTPAGAISLGDIGFRYGRETRNTLSISELHIKAGQRVALIGASGAGKSTLLKLIDGRLRGWSGSCRVLGQRLDPQRQPPRSWRRKVGFVFQEFALVQRETVRRNVLHGRLGHVEPVLSLLGRFTDKDDHAVDRAMCDVHMDAFADKRVDRLSGGQRQRVAIARCLAQTPRLILADEPISSLDPMTAQSILTILRDRASARNATLILSSHQPALVADYVDRFIALDAGRIVFDGPPDQLHEHRLSGIYRNAAATQHERPHEFA
ncbi:phosphonate ABC transporter ATP-binding protein [Pontibaca salina]|uniref:ATP-binding cassette domain-containing protein n=1 Tax=Pontibaca salina TaxID=2795731 RepID=A0A934HTD0_9RHOB|nr:ATP-binding cassette domain-containing protein [Pontibaca salina]MBI6630380.1 ATP-binding cassette domain-containing protein [Pontibaca salina]